MYSTISAAAILAAVPAVRALGQAVVENKCDFPVYLWSVSDSVNPMETLDANDGNYSESYRTNADGGGISIKISRDQSQDSVTQFEYTLTDSLWYDVSNINGYPFEDWGLTLVPSEDGCPNVLCPSGVAACSDAYNIPTDNHATSMCSTEANTVLILCSGQDGSDSPGDAASSVAASAVVTPIAKAISSIVQVPATSAAPAPSSSAAPAPSSSAAPAPSSSATPVAEAQVAAPTSADAVFTTLQTVVATAVATAASEPSNVDSGPQWFGHHQAGWIPKAKRHSHHPHGHYA